MKKLFLPLFGLFLVTSLAGTASAAPLFLEGNSSVTSLAGPVEDDLYTVGGTVNISKPIKGDLIVAGGTINIDSEVTGDVIVAGGTVNIKGTVGDDVRVLAGQVNVEGTIGDDVIAITGDLTLTASSVVKGDVVVTGGKVVLGGRVLGSARINVEEVALEGPTDGDAEIHYSHNFKPGEGARIGGKLAYWAPEENSELAAIASSAVFNKYIPPAGSKGFGVTALIWEFLSLLLLGGLLLLGLPKFFPKAVQDIKKHWSKDFWQGFLVLVTIPVLALIATITVIGLPVALILVLLYGVILMLGGIVGSMYVGSLLVKFDSGSKISIFGSFAVGLAVYTLLGLVPVVGWLAKFFMVLLGIGAIWREKMKVVREYR